MAENFAKVLKGVGGFRVATQGVLQHLAGLIEPAHLRQRQGVVIGQFDVVRASLEPGFENLGRSLGILFLERLCHALTVAGEFSGSIVCEGGLARPDGQGKRQEYCTTEFQHGR